MNDIDCEDINPWWEGNPDERFWLRVTSDDQPDDCLAAPCGDPKRPTSWRRRLVRHVKDGDVVFHYDAGRQAIVGWSTAEGDVQKKTVAWSMHVEGANGDTKVIRMSRPSWAITLAERIEFDPVIRGEQIARTQWHLFDSLRELEDQSGGPIYYPFDLQSKDETRPLRGYVHKLPALIVESIPLLARVFDATERAVIATRDRPAFVGLPVGARAAS